MAGKRRDAEARSRPRYGRGAARARLQPEVRADPAVERPGPRGLVAARCDRHRDGIAQPRDRGDVRPGGGRRRARSRGDPASLRSHDPGARASARAAPARSRHRAPQRVRRRRGRQGSRRVPRRRVVAACHGRARSPVPADRRARVPGGAPRHRRRRVARGARREAALRLVHGDADVLQPRCDHELGRRAAFAGRDVADPPRRAGGGRDHETDAGRRADRRGGFGALPEEEPQDRRPPALTREHSAPTRCSKGSARPSPIPWRRSSACTCSRSTRSAPPSPGSSACSPSSTRWRDRERGGGRGRYGTSAR